MPNYGTWKQTGIPIYTGDSGWYGNEYFVDRTNGLDSNDGLRPGRAFKTIQRAITVQLADTTGLGDTITVLPGTYAESITTSAMANLRLRGVSADAVIVAPTASYGLLVGTDGSTTSTMTNSTIEKMTFLTPSTSNATYAALCVCYMTKSVIQDCKFKGTTTTGFDPTHTTCLQIGNPTDTAWEFHEHSRISRCEFTANGGRVQEPGRCIQVGMASTATPAHKGFKSMIIEDCIMAAYDTAIHLQTGSSSCNGSVIRRNIITSHQGGIGPDIGIKSTAADGTDAMMMIVDNKITSISDCISNFSACNCQNNIVAVGGATPDTEYHDGS